MANSEIEKFAPTLLAVGTLAVHNQLFIRAIVDLLEEKEILSRVAVEQRYEVLKNREKDDVLQQLRKDAEYFRQRGGSFEV